MTLRNDFEELFAKIDITFMNKQADSTFIEDSMFALLGLIIDAEKQTGYQSEIDGAVKKLEKLEGLVSGDNLLQSYLCAVICYMKGDYNGYLSAIEAYIEEYLETYGVIDHDTAQREYLLIFWGMNVNTDDAQFANFLKKFHAILKRLCPDTAFEQYIKYLRLETQNTGTWKRCLRKVLDADDNWACAYEEMGNIFYDEQKWQKTVDNYEKAAAKSDFCKHADLYFSLGYAYYKLRDYAKEEEACRQCLEYDPSYPHANNNLGYSLYKQKRYEESLPYYDREIEIGESTYTYRNKFNSLKRLGRYVEALTLVETNPDRFKTKHYREEVAKMESIGVDMTGILERLKGVTESDFAGSMHVADVMSGIELYPHQRDAIRAMDKAILNTNDYAGLLVLPTGGGKTLTATYWLMNALLDRGKKIIWLAHRHELLNQARRSFEKVCYTDITKSNPSYNWRIISGQHDKPVHIKPNDDIIIASKTSLRRGFSYLLDNWLLANRDNVFMVIDEAHHAAASEYRDLINGVRANTNHFKLLGLTATPFRTADDERGMLKKIFPDDIVYKINLRELINRGILSEPEFRSVSTDVNMLELFQENDSEEALGRIINESFFDLESIGSETAAAIATNSKRNNAIVNEYLNNKDIYKQTLVFALNVEMAIVLNGLFNASGVRSEFVVSNVRDSATGVIISTEENAVKIQKFRDGELDVLVNVNILTEGTDLPKVQSVFLTRPTKSTILMTQMIGRALRGEKAGGTKNAYIVSFIDDWQNKIAWVNSEQLFIDENVDFTKTDHETQRKAMRLVSIAKIEEFAKIANDTVDPRLSELPFIDRIPIGIYKFSYLIDNGEDEDVSKSCDILVYDSMKNAYDEFFAWLPTADLSDADAAAVHVDTTLFGELDSLLGYNQQDVVDIIKYYKQTQDIPRMIYLSERKDYDVSVIAKHIIENKLSPLEKKEYVDSTWDCNNSQWAAFFGVSNQKAFRKLIDEAVDWMLYSDEYGAAVVKPITEKEKVRIQELPLYEIRRRFPALGEHLRDIVFAKYTDGEGYYFSAQSGFRSKNKLDFQIDHIKPMAHGGLTIPDNLQLLRRDENMNKSDK